MTTSSQFCKPSLLHPHLRLRGEPGARGERGVPTLQPTGWDPAAGTEWRLWWIASASPAAPGGCIFAYLSEALADWPIIRGKIRWESLNHKMTGIFDRRSPSLCEALSILGVHYPTRQTYCYTTPKLEVKSLSRVRLFATPCAVVYQAPPSVGFSSQEYWSGLPFPSSGDLTDPGIEPGSPAL